MNKVLIAQAIAAFAKREKKHEAMKKLIEKQRRKAKRCKRTASSTSED